MPKILWSPLPPEVEADLLPPPREDPAATDARIQRLQAATFDVIYASDLAEQAADLGARVALVAPSPHGAFWSLCRAQRADGYARMVPRATLETFQHLHQVLRVLDDDMRASDRAGAPHAATIAALRGLCSAHDFPVDYLAALETVARLGSRAAVLAFLKADV